MMMIIHFVLCNLQGYGMYWWYIHVCDGFNRICACFEQFCAIGNWITRSRGSIPVVSQRDMGDVFQLVYSVYGGVCSL